MIKETETVADDNIENEDLEENSNKALVNIIHCDNDFGDIIEEKAIEEGTAGSRVMTTPEVDRSIPHSSITNIPEEKIEDHDNNTENTLEVIEGNSSNLGIMAIPAVGVKQWGDY